MTPLLKLERKKHQRKRSTGETETQEPKCRKLGCWKMSSHICTASKYSLCHVTPSNTESRNVLGIKLRNPLRRWVGLLARVTCLFILSFLSLSPFYLCVSLTMLLKEKLYWSQKQLIVCFVTQLKEPSPRYISVFSFVFKCRYMRGYHYTFGEFHIF